MRRPKELEWDFNIPVLGISGIAVIISRSGAFIPAHQ
jgi:hypothetical protein